MKQLPDQMTQEVQINTEQDFPYLDTFLGDLDQNDDSTSDSNYDTDSDDQEDYFGAEHSYSFKTAAEDALLKTSLTQEEQEFLTRLNLSPKERNMYRSLLSHTLKQKFLLYKKQARFKDEYLLKNLKREYSKMRSMRCKMDFMRLLQEKRDLCVRDLFHLGKKAKFSLMELHRVYVAAMYLYGSDEYWFGHLHRLQQARERRNSVISAIASSTTMSTNTESTNQQQDTSDEHANRISLNINTYKEAENYLHQLAVSPLVERIRNEKVWLQQQLDNMVEDPSYLPPDSVHTPLSKARKSIQHNFEDLLTDLSQQLRVNTNMLFEKLESEGPELNTIGTQTTWKPFSGRDVLLTDDLLDEFLFVENQNKLATERQKKTELSTVLLETKQSLQHVVAKIKRYQKSLQKETSEIKIIEKAFQNKMQLHDKKMSKINEKIAEINEKESREYVPPETLATKRALERKVIKMEEERQQEEAQHTLVCSRYDRSLITLQQRIEEYEKHRHLHETKIKSLTFRLRVYDENKTDKMVISKKKAPQGRIAIMFTDIESSTSAWEKAPEAMEKALVLHNKIIRYLIEKTDGFEVKTEGDAFMIVWSSVASAVECALAIQMKLHTAKWEKDLLELEEACQIDDEKGRIMFRGLRVRIGIGVGEPLVRMDPTTGREDFFGPAINKSARVESFAKGGQIAISQEVWKEIEPRLHKFTYRVWHKRLGSQKLKGISGDHGIIHILPEVLSHRRWQNLSPVERAMNQLQLENKNLRTKIAELEDEASNLRAQLKFSESIIEDNEAMIEKLNGKIEKHKNSLKEYDQRMQDVRQELERRQVMIEYKVMEVNRLEVEKENIHRENTTLKQVIYVLKRDIDSCERTHRDVLYEAFGVSAATGENGALDLSALTPPPQVANMVSSSAGVESFSRSDIDALTKKEWDHTPRTDGSSMGGFEISPHSSRKSSIASFVGRLPGTARSATTDDNLDDGDHATQNDGSSSARSDISFIQQLCGSNKSSRPSTVYIGPGDDSSIISAHSNEEPNRDEASKSTKKKRNKKRKKRHPSSSSDKENTRRQHTHKKPSVKKSTTVVTNIEQITDSAIQSHYGNNTFVTNRKPTLSLFRSEATTSDMIAPQTAAPNYFSQHSPGPHQMYTTTAADNGPNAGAGGSTSNSGASIFYMKKIEDLNRQLNLAQSQRNHYRNKYQNLLMKQADEAEDSNGSHFYPHKPSTAGGLSIHREEHALRNHSLQKVSSVTAPTPQKTPASLRAAMVFSSSSKKKSLNRIGTNGSKTLGRPSTSYHLHSTPKRLLKCVMDSVDTSLSNRKRSKSSLARRSKAVYAIDPASGI